MHHREPRSYAYDDQTAYATTLQQTADYNTNGYPAYDAAGHYYTAPVHAVGHLNDGANAFYHVERHITDGSVSRQPVRALVPKHDPVFGLSASLSSIE